MQNCYFGLTLDKDLSTIFSSRLYATGSLFFSILNARSIWVNERPC